MWIVLEKRDINLSKVPMASKNMKVDLLLMEIDFSFK